MNNPADMLWRINGKSAKMNPHAIANVFLETYNTIRRTTDSETYQFVNNTWNPLPDKDLSNLLKDFILSKVEEEDSDTYFSVTAEIKTSLLDEIAKQVIRLLDREQINAKLEKTMIPAKDKLLTFNHETKVFYSSDYSVEVFAPMRLTAPFNPDAKCPEFLEKVRENVPDPDNLRVVQEMLGASLFMENRTRKFLIFQGEGSTGKSFLINIMRRILGDNRFFDLSNIRNLHNDFELASLNNQTFMYASEAVSGALCSSGSEMIKKMVGGDFFETSLKFQNERRAHMGYYSLVIVTNNKVRLHFESRGDEWRDRIILIPFNHHIEHRDGSLEDRLITNEGSGILNWLLEGAAKVLTNNWEISLTPAQETLRDKIIATSHSVDQFVRKYVELKNGKFFSSREALEWYNYIREQSDFQYYSDTKFYRELSRVMSDVFGATSSNNLCGGKIRGYDGFVLKKNI